MAADAVQLKKAKGNIRFPWTIFQNPTGELLETKN